jgi:hypothetical protein
VNPAALGGEDNLFRAGRIALIPNPEPGVWTIRIEGAGPYFLAVQAHTSIGLHVPQFSNGTPRLGADQNLTVMLNAPVTGVRFSLVGADGDQLQPLVLNADADLPGRFSGSVVPAFREFRIRAEGTDERGFAFQRVHAPLFEAK